MSQAKLIRRTTYAPTIGLSETAKNGEIMINSRSPHQTEAVPTFYTVEGEPIIGETIYLSPNEVRFASIESLIPNKYHGRQDWGGMSISFTGHSMEIAPQITLHGTNRSGSFDVSFSELGGGGSNAQEAVWRMPEKGKIIIALGNSSDETVHATLQFSDGETLEEDIKPFATRYVQRNPKNNDEKKKGGIGESVKLITTGASGRLKTAGFVFSKDDKSTSGIRFYDTRNATQPNLYAADFKPKNATAHLMLKNTTEKAITAAPRFLPVSGESGAFELPAVKIPAGGIIEVDLKPLMKAVKTKSDLELVSVQIINSGAAGSLIGSLVSADDSSGTNYDIPLRDSGAASHSTGGYPARLDDDYQTILSITNVGDKASKFTMQINYDGGRYVAGLRELKTGATAIFDIRKLRDEQIPDIFGAKLPEKLTVAQIRWSLSGNTSARLIGRAEITSQSNKVSSSYSCGACCPNTYESGSIEPAQAYVYAGDTFQFTAEERDRDCYSNIFEYYADCNWTSDNYNIGDINHSGLATAIGAGDAQITANWTADSWLEDIDAGCQYSTVEAAPVADLIVQPLSVSIDSFKAVGKNPPNTDFRAKIRIIVNNPNNVPITLTLYPIQGTTGEAQFADINTTTTTITQTTDVEIRGITESSTENNMRLEAAYNGHSLDKEDFTVLSVVLSLRFGSTEDYSSDNDKKDNQIAATGRSKLGGPFFVTGTGNKIWGHSIEIVGTVLPANYPDPIILQREVVESKTYQGMTFLFATGCSPPVTTPCNDTSFPAFLDTTVSSQGHIFDNDNPGFDLINATMPGTIRRRRTNFRQWATVEQKDAGITKAVRVSPDITWFQRLSVKYVGTPMTELSNDVTGDNEIGSGTTSLTWDLM